jgi:hypothetical protein
VLVGLAQGEDVGEGKGMKIKVNCEVEKNDGKGRGKGKMGAKVYLKYRRIGSATLKSSTPGGSTILKHLMVATY